MYMVGILCNRHREGTFAKYLHILFKPLIKRRNIPVIVFSIRNINFSEKTVFGSLISEEKIALVKTAIPFLIFNFAVQHTKLDIKKLRSLMELEDVSMINSANKYNQWAIMEMLSSGSKTKNYILPYKNYNKEDIYFNFLKNDNFILKPENGSHLSRIFYGKQSDSSFDLYNRYGNQYCHKFDIQSVIHPITRVGKWLLLKTPDLITYKNRLFIIRAYMQRGFNGDWGVLLKTTVAQNKIVYEKLGRKIDASSLQIIKYISCFIPDLGICFIDFVLDTGGTPYFLNFGGWDSKLLSKNQSRGVRASLCKNILDYAEMLIDKKSNILSL